jgi:ADP-ribose pyrophosphatase YjhB (NUDIX family)
MKRSIARLMRRSPLLHTLLVLSLQTLAARFTVGVNGVVYNQDGEILLLEHVFRCRHAWGLPGGWVGRRERPQAGLRRELLEEVGLAVEVGPPLHVDLGEPAGHLETSFLCEARGEPGLLSKEILNLRWVDPEKLPDGIKPRERALVRRAQELRKLLMNEHRRSV